MSEMPVRYMPLLFVVLILCICSIAPLSLRNGKGERTPTLSNSVGRSNSVQNFAHYTYKAAVEDQSPTILVDFIAEKFSAKKTQAKQWLVYKSVYVNDEIQDKYNFDLRVGDIVSVRLGKIDTSKQQLNSCAVGRLPNGLKIVYEDSSIIVIEKPHKMLVSAKDIALKDKTTKAIQTALHHINSVLGKRKKSSKAMLVHSLDEDASGLMIFAKTLSAKEYLLSNWYSNIGKTFTCICYGKLSPLQGILSCSGNKYNESFKRVEIASVSIPGELNKDVTSYGQIGGIKYNYTSSYRSLDVSSNMPYSMVEFSLDRMSTEQLQLKLCQLEKPVVGDLKRITSTGGDYDPLRRLCMHCSEIKLFHPETKEKMSFQSPVPSSFLSLLRRKSGKGDLSVESVINRTNDNDDYDDEIYEKRNIEIVKISDFLKQK